MVKASASAKVILFGEHAVVYGEPAIAVPVSALRAEVEVIETNQSFHIIARDLNNKVIDFDGDDPLAQVAQLVFARIGQTPPKITLAVQSNVPIASGLGSGAAISTAIVRALLAYGNVSLGQEEINQIIYEVEKIHHGTPSGIDNTVVVYEQPVYFVREHPIEILNNRQDFQLLIADTGQASLTKIAVGDVRKLYEHEPERIKAIFSEIGKITILAREAMQQGHIEALGKLMWDNHQFLQALTVSSLELDKLIYAARIAGAMGAKLSGGGRGGNMIALVKKNTGDSVKKALLDAGAVRVFETVVEKSGNGHTS
jgi:mevalonate kinase